MKELSIEEKARRYDKAIEKAKEFKNNPFAGYDGTDLLSSLFPELKEREDERIRKWLIKDMGRRLSCWTSTEVTKEQVLAWLEKQGEQKPVISEDALREGIAHFGITQYQIDNWLKKYVDVEKQVEQKPTEYRQETKPNGGIVREDFR